MNRGGDDNSDASPRDASARQSGTAATVADAGQSATAATVADAGHEGTSALRVVDILSSGPTLMHSAEGSASSPDSERRATHPETPSARTSTPVIRPSRPSISDARYILGDEIARGGMGRVVEATDRLLGRTVAVKEALIPEGELRERFMRETRITARLEHPSIVPIYDAGTTSEGAPFYVMRRVTGQPLEELVHAAKTLDQRLMLLPHLLAAANAIAHAHNRGVLHRDIKPSNILVGKLGETVVIDWGLAKVIGEPDDPNDSMLNLSGGDGVMTRVGSVVGTPGFMPPEQLKGEPVDARSDVYALGATLYFLLSRQPPHAGKTGDAMMVAALAGPPPPIRDLVPGLASELSTIVDKALAYEHGARYADAGGLAEDLERFLTGQLVASHRYSRRERLIRFWRRHRISISIAATAVVAIAIGAWLAIGRVIDAQRRTDAALSEALERNELLELARARSMLDISPTAALALARPLAAKHWNEVAVIAMAARATGVAYGLPASSNTLSLELSRDGKMALAAGDDGVIRIYDLATRLPRVVAELGESASATYADDDRTIVAWTARQMTIIDVGSGTRRVRAFAGAPRGLRAAGRTLWWIDREGAVWLQSLDEAEPRALGLDDRALAIEVHGSSVAVAGEGHLWVVRNGAPVAVAHGKVSAVAWSNDARVGAILGENARVVELDSRDQIAVDVVVPGAMSVAWLGDVLYVGAKGSVARLGGASIAVNGSIPKLQPGPSGTLVARSSRGLAVITPAMVIDVPATSALGETAASPASRYVLAGSDGVVLMFNLDHVVPRRWTIGSDQVVSFAGAEQLAVSHDDHTLSWVDLRTETQVTVPLRGQLVHAAFAPDRSRLVVSESDGRATLYTRGQAAGVMFDEPTSMAVFVNGGIVLGAPTGEIRLYDLSSRTTSLLFKGTGLPWSMQGEGVWTAVLFEDGRAMRVNLATGTTTSLPARLDRWMWLREGGEALVSEAERLRRWTVAGTFIDGPLLPPPVSAILPAGRDQVVVFTGGTTAHLVELEGERRVTLAYPPGSRMHQLRFEGDLGVFIDTEGAEMYVTAPRSAISWRIGRVARSILTVPTLSVDRTKVYAVTGGDVLIWKQTIPSSAVEVTALIDELTNAHMTPGARVTEQGSLRWTW